MRFQLDRENLEALRQLTCARRQTGPTPGLFLNHWPAERPQSIERVIGRHRVTQPSRTISESAVVIEKRREIFLTLFLVRGGAPAQAKASHRRPGVSNIIAAPEFGLRTKRESAVRPLARLQPLHELGHLTFRFLEEPFHLQSPPGAQNMAVTSIPGRCVVEGP